MARKKSTTVGQENSMSASGAGGENIAKYWKDFYSKRPDLLPLRSNDEAVGAMTLTYGHDYSATFNTQNATQSQPGANCSVADFADDDIWFKFVATASPARIVVGYHTADVALELFSGTPGNLTSIACDGNILILPMLTAGQTYYARLYSWKNATPAAGRVGLFITPSLTANSCVDETCLGPVLLENPVNLM